MEALSKVDFAKLNAGVEPIRNMASAIKSMEGIQDIQVPKNRYEKFEFFGKCGKKIFRYQNGKHAGGCGWIEKDI